jgi:hypothetical protein
MSKSASYRIFTRFNIAIIAIILLLFGAITLHNIKKNFEIDSNGVFIPISLVMQTKAAIEVIQRNIHNSSSISDFPCSQRQLLILAEVVSEKKQISTDESKKIVIDIWRQLAQKELSPSCKTFPQIVKNSYAVLELHKADIKNSLDRIIRERYSENVRWDKSALCVYARDSLGFFLANGNYHRCKDEKIEYIENAEKRNLIRKGIQPIISLAKNQGQLKKDQAPLYLTIDADMQYKLAHLLECNKVNCPTSIQRIIDQIDLATVSVIDADRNEILAIGCYGLKCGDSDNKYIGLLMGSNVEVPPASTAKLIFSLAIAQNNPTLQNELSFQIKTSGQLDQSVTKRNEWWEKVSICNSKKNCEIPLQAESFAKKLGWNRYCDQKGNLQCGKTNILAPLGINAYSPRSGRILVQSKKDGPYIKPKNLFGEYLNWNDYEDIRLDKKKPANNFLLEKTSLVIQSVIGAGDSRTTSLGLAMLSAGIYESSRQGRIRDTNLFRINNNNSHDLPTNTGKAVLNGMRKVTMSSEKNWIGVGTAHTAFMNTFGISCTDDCPIFAKTGTVSQQDKVYAGTTLFTAIVLSDQLNKKIGRETKDTKKNIAIGVITKAKQNGGEHFASKLGMQLIKDLNHNE